MRTMRMAALAAAAVVAFAACDGNGNDEVATPVNDPAAASPITDGTGSDAGDDATVATPLPDEAASE